MQVRENKAKPVLIGMNNPLHSDPKYALFPYPPGCTGHRIFKMLESRRPGVLRAHYLETFERINLVDGKTWIGTDAKGRRVLQARANSIVSAIQGRTAVLLGNAVRDAFGVPPLLVHPQESRGVTWRQLPHPSGRCHWYNDPKNREVAALLFEELFLEYNVPRERGRMTEQEVTHEGVHEG